MVVLSAISVAIDRYRGDAPERETPLSVLSYLLFYPTMLIGPILRYKQFLYATEHIAPSRKLFSQGALLFMRGYVKRIAVAAVIARMLSALFSLRQTALPPAVLPLLLLLALALLYAFITGTTDMARGLMAMFGMPTPRAQYGMVPQPLPHRMLFSLLLPFERYLEDYVARPIRQRLPNKRAALIATLLTLVCTLLLLRTHPAVLLLALPLLLAVLLSYQTPRYHRTPRNALLRVLLALLSLVLLSLLALGILLDEPLSLFGLFANVFGKGPRYPLQYLFGTVFDSRYLWFIAVFLASLPIAHGGHALLQRLPKRAVFALRCASALLITLCFMATLVYFTPQFPHYADPVYGSFILR